MQASQSLTKALPDTASGHIDHAHALAAGEPPARGLEAVAPSWRRSANDHGVDPAAAEPPRILTERELTEQRQSLESLIVRAQEEIDGLYGMVRQAGYVVLFCDTGGVAVDHRGDRAAADAFRQWGTWLGGVWSETIEGTNGIGTCIAEGRPVTVHRSQHFRWRHKNLSCSGAPIFDVDGTLRAVLDVSAVDPLLSEGAHALTGVLTQTAARAIEERLFRERFDREWIVMLAPPEPGAPAMLLAVDDGYAVIGADRTAGMGLIPDGGGTLPGVSLWNLFERDLALFRRPDSADLPARLVRIGTGEAWLALVTPPRKLSRVGSDRFSLHARPRLAMFGAFERNAPRAAPARGGLPAATLRRVRDYVDAHLDENIDLGTMAGIAGVSVFHFARQFKLSTGLTPHGYLVQRRIERASEMMARTDLPLSQIALLTGFADQGHFSRRFRQLTGTSPRRFRRELS